MATRRRSRTARGDISELTFRINAPGKSNGWEYEILAYRLASPARGVIKKGVTLPLAGSKWSNCHGASSCDYTYKAGSINQVGKDTFNFDAIVCAKATASKLSDTFKLETAKSAPPKNCRIIPPAETEEANDSDFATQFDGTFMYKVTGIVNTIETIPTWKLTGKKPSCFVCITKPLDQTSQECTLHTPGKALSDDLNLVNGAGELVEEANNCGTAFSGQNLGVTKTTGTDQIYTVTGGAAPTHIKLKILASIC